MTTRAARRRARIAARRRRIAAVGVIAFAGLDIWAFGLGASGEDNHTSAEPTPSTVTTESGSMMSAGAAEAARPTPVAPARGATAPRSAPPAPTASQAVVQHGDGKFTILAVPASALGTPPEAGRTVRYTVEIEGGLGVDTPDYAATVARVLADARGWETLDKVRFVNVSPAQANDGAQVDVRVTLASPDTTDRLCAPLLTRGRVSCFAKGRAVLNVKRWLLGVPEAYGTDVAAYRIYQINHEVGHGIGHGHAYCPGKGKPAPVMMQQTYGLDGCTPWPWPTPKSA